MTDLFAYDPSAPLAITGVVRIARRRHSADIRYPSPVTGKPIGAYRVTPPPGDAPHPAILYVHWYEPSAPNSNRTQFLDEAETMAREYGVESLLVETMWSQPDWYRAGRSLASDYDDAIRQVIELRRGLDVLLSQPGIDPARVAYVGHDFGAMYGALLSAVDRRAKAFVFVAGASNFNNWMLFGVPPDQPGLDDYKARMEPLAPARFVARTAPAAILFQFGSEDFYTPEADYTAFFNTASEPKDVRVYPSEHAMDSDAIRADRIAFLVSQLGLKARS
ncbi:MAG: hypothetical protein U0521_18580 [Anaerolineae bacterium]